MANILPPEEQKVAKAWFHDIFVWGGFAEPQRSIGISRYRYMYGQDPENFRKDNDNYRLAAILICNAITQRVVGVKQFEKYDNALKLLSQCYFTPEVLSSNRHNGVKKSPEELATYIAWFCYVNNWWWDNRLLSKFEEVEIFEHSILGKALYDHFCFYVRNNEPEPEEGSADAENSEETGEAEADETETKADTTSTQQAQPDPNGKQLSPWKARGPLSGVAVDLISTPGQPENLHQTLYGLCAIDANGKALSDCAYIRPVEDKNQQKFMVGNTNKLLFGKPSGWGSCPILFKTSTEADDYLKKVSWSKITSMMVGVAKKQGTGKFYNIGTEYGPCYISTAKLNEDLTEDVEKPEEKKLTNKDKWKKFEELFTTGN